MPQSAEISQYSCGIFLCADIKVRETAGTFLLKSYLKKAYRMAVLCDVNISC